MSEKVNSNRHYNPDPPVPAHIRLPGSMLAAIDEVRGDQSRTAFIREAIKSALYYEGKLDRMLEEAAADKSPLVRMTEGVMQRMALELWVQFTPASESDEKL